MLARFRTTSSEAYLKGGQLRYVFEVAAVEIPTEFDEGLCEGKDAGSFAWVHTY